MYKILYLEYLACVVSEAGGVKIRYQGRSLFAGCRLGG